MVVVRRQQMACLYLLLLLMILPWEGAKFADGSARFNKFVSGPSSNQIQRDDVQSHHHGSFFNGNSEHKTHSHGDDNGDGDDDDDDEGLLDEKRRIHTGPNPLHNR